MDGVALGARFSLATSRREYCGPAGASPALYAAILEGGDPAPAARALSSFEALWPYLEVIAEKHGRAPLDLDVVEAYWIGNELLDAFEREDFLPLLDRLVRRGLPRRIADRLAGSLPPGAIPHHTFHVIFVGVGNVTGHVPTNLESMEQCRPSWATVREVRETELTVRIPRLVHAHGQLTTGPEEESTVDYDPRVLPDVRPGAAVALHWGWPAIVLSEEQRRNLEHYSRLSLAAANAAPP